MTVCRLFWKKLVDVADAVKMYKNPFLSSMAAFLVMSISTNLSDRARAIDPVSDLIEWIALGAFGLFSVFWLLSTERVRHFAEKEFVRSKFGAPKIGVFRTADASDADFAQIKDGCDFAPQSWVKGLQTHNISVRTLECFEPIKSLDVLMNPYGQRYLESDISNMRTLKEIKHFVKNGGLFVSMGGLAFFYMYDPKSNIEGLTGPMVEYHVGGVADQEFHGITGTFRPTTVLEPVIHPDASSLVETWLFRNLGARTTLGSETTRAIQAAHKGFEDLLELSPSVQEFRAIERCESMDNELIPIFKARYKYLPTEREHQCYPVAVIRHGLGYFVICGIIVNKQEHKTLVENTVVRLCRVLSEQGRLDSRQSAP